MISQLIRTLVGTFLLALPPADAPAGSDLDDELVVRILPGADRETLELISRIAEGREQHVAKDEELRGVLESHYGASEHPSLWELLHAANPWLEGRRTAPKSGTLVLPAGPRWTSRSTIEIPQFGAVDSMLRLHYGVSGPQTRQRLAEYNAIGNVDDVRVGTRITLPFRGSAFQTLVLKDAFVAERDRLRAKIDADPQAIARTPAPIAAPRPVEESAPWSCGGRAVHWPFDREGLMEALHRNQIRRPRDRTPVLAAIADTGIPRNETRLLKWRNQGEYDLLPDHDDDHCGYKDDVFGADLVGDGQDVRPPIISATTARFRNHGVHVAGLVQGGAVSDCLPRLLKNSMELMILKVSRRASAGENEENAMDERALLEAIREASLHGAHIVNMSLEGGHVSSIGDKIHEAQGQLFVVAAGNGDDDYRGLDLDESGRHSFPAGLGGSGPFPNLVTVAAHDGAGHPAPFSNFGERSVDLAAPGCAIESFGEHEDRLRISGTSQATALVSMVAALLFREGLKTPLEVKQRLMSSADVHEAWKGKAASSGVLNPIKAVSVFDDLVETRDGQLLHGRLTWPRGLSFPETGELHRSRVRKIVPQYDARSDRPTRVLFLERGSQWEPRRLHSADVRLPIDSIELTVGKHKHRIPIENVLDIIPRAIAPLSYEQVAWKPAEALREPSGIAATDLQTAAGLPVMVAVHDDSKLLYLVGQECGALSVLREVEFGNATPDDLEAITFDGSHHFALTSHRRLDAEQAATRQLLRFRLDRNALADNQYRVEAEVRDLSSALRAFLADHDIPVDEAAWRRKAPRSEKWHPYAVELEGIAANGGLWIGLKWPLDAQRRALLLAYNWEANAFTGLHRIALGGFGISGLDMVDGTLLVAANPPEKELGPGDSALGRSRVCAVRPISGAPGLSPVGCTDAFAAEDSKLEGIAASEDGRHWLAYDGGARQGETSAVLWLTRDQWPNEIMAPRDDANENEE